MRKKIMSVNASDDDARTQCSTGKLRGVRVSVSVVHTKSETSRFDFD
jgi:hypothetical protein